MGYCASLGWGGWESSKGWTRQACRGSFGSFAVPGLESAPMIPDLTEEDLAIRDAVRRFARKELAPRAAEFDETAAFVGAHLPGLAALGIMGLNLPEEFGGAGISALGLM